jgi:hypothetical protein
MHFNAMYLQATAPKDSRQIYPSDLRRDHVSQRRVEREHPLGYS